MQSIETPAGVFVTDWESRLMNTGSIELVRHFCRDLEVQLMIPSYLDREEM